MRRVAAGTTVLILVWAAPTLAAPLNTPGVALVKATQTTDPVDGDPEGNAVYNGTTGPVTGNAVTIVETGNQLAFTAPLTLIAPSPLAGDQYVNCSYGLGHATCTIPAAGYYGYSSGCSAEVMGNTGPDRITMRLGPPPPPYAIPTDCFYIFTTVTTKGGNDVIRVNDSEPTNVVCGAGYDTVVADAYDSVASDCEAVGRV